MTDQMTFELTRGYIDDDGHAHTTVTLREPRMDDEVIADRRVALKATSTSEEVRAESQSSSLWEMEVMASCIVTLGEIRRVTSDHIRALHRRDYRLIRRKLTELEDALSDVESAPNSSGAAPASSS